MNLLKNQTKHQGFIKKITSGTTYAKRCVFNAFDGFAFEIKLE
jgi:hypothetical protein